ncbi:MAG: hypothetical protein KDA69_14435, partial [Planctomycetaceae bacterium]|nr:hypothetical protein [Planctomycetaceae bacterium]
MKRSAWNATLLSLLVQIVIAAETFDAVHAESIEPAIENVSNAYRFTDTCNTFVLRSGDAALLINVGDGLVFEHLTDMGVERGEQVLLTDHHRENCQGLLRDPPVPLN